VLLITGLIFVLNPSAAVDINVDGNLDDWGLSKLKTEDLSDPNTWIPTISGVSFFVEDNQDPTLTGAYNYNPSYTGVHIYGNNTWQATYHESYVYMGSTPVAEPVNGGNPIGWLREPYDIEAIYITENKTHIFVLIVTSAYDTSGPLGDLALDFWLGGEYGYEYGVNFHREGNKDGELYGIYETTKPGSWDVPDNYHPNTPGEINFSVVGASDKVGKATVAWSMGNPDYNINNMFIEVAIPKDAINNPTLPPEPDKAIRKVWMSEYCGNDSGPSIPEFLTVLVPAGIIFGFIGYVRRRRK